MTTDGGGWTGVSFAVAETWLEGTMTALESAATQGIDATYGPYTRDSGSAAHSYVYDLEFPPGFEAFYLSDYEIMANPVSGGSSDVWPAYFVRTDWSVAYAVATSCCYGDVAFGDADDAPVTSLAANLSARTHYSQGEVVSWPGGDDIYTLASAETFRVGWGDGGGESEGWYPWYSGAVYLR
jgi:hypothetical protein